MLIELFLDIYGIIKQNNEYLQFVINFIYDFAHSLYKIVQWGTDPTNEQSTRCIKMVVKVVKVETQVAVMSAEPVFRTYEQICLDKLKKIGRSTAAQWAFAMGYTNPNALRKVIRRITTNTPLKIKKAPHVKYPISGPTSPTGVIVITS